MGFNALPRAFFFSVNSGALEYIIKTPFQCPTSGFLLFYKRHPKTCEWLFDKWSFYGFNALPRAFFFSIP